MQHAVEEEVVALEHVQVVDAVVVLAGEEVGEPAAEVVVGLGMDVGHGLRNRASAFRNPPSVPPFPP